MTINCKAGYANISFMATPAHILYTLTQGSPLVSIYLPT